MGRLEAIIYEKLWVLDLQMFYNWYNSGKIQEMTISRFDWCHLYHGIILSCSICLFTDFVYGVKMEPTWKYIWNLHLLKPVQNQLHPDWILYITHGFIGQSSILLLLCWWCSFVLININLNRHFSICLYTHCKWWSCQSVRYFQ